MLHVPVEAVHLWQTIFIPLCIFSSPKIFRGYYSSVLYYTLSSTSRPTTPFPELASPPTCLNMKRMKIIRLETIHRMARLWLCVLAPYSILSHQCALSASWLMRSQIRGVCICDFTDLCCQNQIKILVEPFSFYFYICETK